MKKSTNVKVTRDLDASYVAPSKSEIQYKLSTQEAIHYIEEMMDTKYLGSFNRLELDALLMAIQSLRENAPEDKEIIDQVYCESDGYIVFMHKNGDATIEPICEHPELEGKIKSVNSTSRDFVMYHTW